MISFNRMRVSTRLIVAGVAVLLGLGMYAVNEVIAFNSAACDAGVIP